MIKKLEYHSVHRHFNEEKILIFDDAMHREQLYFDTPICLFLTRGVGTNKTSTLKLIIQGLLRLYNR
jgi:hypothetical protein